jgi:alpha-L-fucosidase 2
MKPLIIKYTSPATDNNQGWEQYSLPLGCGHFGANVFGLIERERIQITENSVLTKGNLTNAAEIYICFPHSEASDYERGLILNKASAYCRYTSNNVCYTREYFTSYPDNVMVVKLTADQIGALMFTLAPEIPFQHPFGDKNNNEAMGKIATTKAIGNTIEIDCKLEYYGINFSAQFRIETDGIIKTEYETISVSKATEAVIYFSCGTNYVLGTQVFNEDVPSKKLDPVDPRDRIFSIVNEASNKGYATLKANHEKDFSSIFDRVELNLESYDDLDELPTDVLLDEYKAGKRSGYLETLYYQYGRYLLISSSRKGCLPANLQGIWTCHEKSPWGSGYWHNINVQMNYWPVFSTNMVELFSPYCDLNMAFREKAEGYAEEYIKKHNPESYHEGDDCGWCIGTAVYPYESGGAPGGHSGPGTGGLTTKMYWDYWEFTRDHEILREVVYPTVLSMSRFLTRTVRKYDGCYLTCFSASPEQMLKGRYYHTVGCAFDQQML